MFWQFDILPVIFRLLKLLLIIAGRKHILKRKIMFPYSIEVELLLKTFGNWIVSLRKGRSSFIRKVENNFSAYTGMWPDRKWSREGLINYIHVHFKEPGLSTDNEQHPTKRKVYQLTKARAKSCQAIWLLSLFCTAVVLGAKLIICRLNVSCTMAVWQWKEIFHRETECTETTWGLSRLG